MNTQEFLETHVISSIIQVFNASISKIMYIKLEQEEGHCGKREVFQNGQECRQVGIS
jgi:hypothetical protein